MRLRLLVYLLLSLILITSASADFNAYGQTQIIADTCMQTQSEVTLKNTDKISQTITLSTAGKIADYVKFSAISTRLQPGMSKKIKIYYDIPCDLKAKTYSLDVYFTGYENEKILTQEVLVQQLDSLDLKTIEPVKTIQPGQEAQFLLALKNPTQLVETYDISVEIDEKLEATASVEKKTLQPEESIEIIITAKAKEIITTGEFKIEINAKTQKTLQEKILPLELTIENSNFLEIAKGIQTIRTDYQKSAAKLIVRNKGESTASYSLTLDAPEWITIEPAAITLDSQEEQQITLMLAPQETVKKADYDVTVRAISGSAEYTKQIIIKLKPKNFFERHTILTVIFVLILLGILTGAVMFVHLNRKPSFRKKLRALKKKFRDIQKKRAQKKKRKEAEKKKKEAGKKKKEAEEKRKKENLQKEKERAEKEKQRQKEKAKQEKQKAQKKVEKDFKKTHHVIAKEKTIKGLKSKSAILILIVLAVLLLGIIGVAALAWKQNKLYVAIGLGILVVFLILDRLSKIKIKGKRWRLLRESKTIKAWKQGLTAITPKIRTPIEKFKLIVKKKKPHTKPSQNILQTFEVKTNVKEEQDFKITIKVPKKWAAKQDEVKLGQFMAHRWQKVSLIKSGEDKKYVYYAATISKGTYSIYGKKKEKKKKSSRIKLLVAGIIFLAVLTGIAVLTIPLPTKTFGIPAQTWKQDTTHTLDISQYFTDPDNEELSYSTTATEHITIDFVEGKALLTPETGWTGEEYVRFIAEDKARQKAESNIVKLKVTERMISQAIQPYVALGLAILTILLILVTLRKARK